MTRTYRLLAAVMLSAVPTLHADDPPKAFPASFGVSAPIYALSGTIGVTYYGWEETTVFGQTLWAFTGAQFATNAGNGCFTWTGCGATIAGTSLGTKPYGVAANPYLPGGSPQFTSFGWTPGTEIIFAIMVDQQDGFNWFFSGDPLRNTDQLAHLAYFDPTAFPDGVPGNQGVGVVPQTQGLALFGFEDVTYQYSDWDFDNLMFAVDGIDTPTETVPEPATLALMATGLGGLAALRRRWRHHEQA